MRIGITINGVIRDFIGKFENLEADFNKVCDKIGIPRQRLSHHNCKEQHYPGENHQHYSCYYDDESRKLVSDKYRRDIEIFDYTYENIRLKDQNE